MAAIRSLLNPAPEPSNSSESEFELSTQTKQFPSQYWSPNQMRKKQKICKDAAIFIRGPIRGDCRYPPHEQQGEHLAAQHQRFDIYPPVFEIANYPRHIPYNSEKKFFFEKTGRESLEVFQYNFKIPGDDTQYAMLWDYNIGLVRTTPLFKCTGHSKTTPAKMLNRNPGLRDLCHSITGGALVAQGYWMPFDAAKAVAATFCWNIRYALTPVFGVDFPAKCIPPNFEKYGDMTIDPVITENCAKEANKFREKENDTTSRPSPEIAAPLTPDTPTHPRGAKQLRPKLLQNVNSEYSSDIGSDDNYTVSSMTPEPAYRGLWTPANTPRSVPRLSSPSYTLSRKRPANADSCNDLSSPELSPKSHRVIEVDEAYDGDSSDDSGRENCGQTARKVSNGPLSDEKAAYLLMSLKLQSGNNIGFRGKKRRAST